MVYMYFNENFNLAMDMHIPFKVKYFAFSLNCLADSQEVKHSKVSRVICTLILST